MQNKLYKGLSISNDLRALYKGRILQRLWNKKLLKIARKFLK